MGMTDAFDKNKADFSVMSPEAKETRPVSYTHLVVGKKYRGNYAKCMEQYVRSRLERCV